MKRGLEGRTGSEEECPGGRDEERVGVRDREGGKEGLREGQGGSRAYTPSLAKFANFNLA